MHITTPAFELNPTVLFRKDSADEAIGSCNASVDPDLDRLSPITRSLAGCISQTDEELKDCLDQSNPCSRVKI